MKGRSEFRIPELKEIREYEIRVRVMSAIGGDSTAISNALTSPELPQLLANVLSTASGVKWMSVQTSVACTSRVHFELRQLGVYVDGEARTAAVTSGYPKPPENTPVDGNNKR